MGGIKFYDGVIEGGGYKDYYDSVVEGLGVSFLMTGLETATCYCAGS